MTTWICDNCQGLVDADCTSGVSCKVESGWPEKPTACPMDKSNDCDWKEDKNI